MLEPIQVIAALSVAFVKIKYPHEFFESSYYKTVLELIEMVGEELAAKNFETISKDYFNQIATVENFLKSKEGI